MYDTPVIPNTPEAEGEDYKFLLKKGRTGEDRGRKNIYKEVENDFLITFVRIELTVVPLSYFKVLKMLFN